MTQQPKWKLLGTVGDVNPLDHSGGFVFVDETGVYDPEIEWIEPEGENEYGEPIRWKVYRWSLEKCTYQNGILSDNPYHPDYPAWFAKPESERKHRPQDTTYLLDICKTMDVSEKTIISNLCGDDIMARANAYLDIARYHGMDNFDEYRLSFSDREELEYWIENRRRNQPINR